MKIQRVRRFISNKKSGYIDCAAAFQYLGKEDVKFLDIRQQSSYLNERLPGSLLASKPLQYRKIYDQQGLSYMQKYFAEYFYNVVKIKKDDYVIAYDESLLSQYGPSVTQFLLNYLGHKNVSILDGGLESWKVRNLSVESGNQLNRIQQQILENQDKVGQLLGEKEGQIKVDQSEVLVNIDYIQKALENGDTYIVDVREPQEFKQGRIPNSVNIPLSQLFQVQQNGAYVRKQNEIQNILKNKQISQQDQIVVYCKMGYRSSQAWTALKNAGFNKVYNYGGSFYEWENSNNRVEK